MEEKYNLQIVEPMRAAQQIDRYEQAQGSISNTLRVVLDEGISKYSTEKELYQFVEKKGYKVQVGRGISFVHKESGETIKGSSLGREYSLKNIQTRLQHSPDEKHELNTSINAKEILRTRLIDGISNAGNREEFAQFLQEKYGITMIDSSFEKNGRTYQKTDFQFTHQGKPYLIPQSEMGPNFQNDSLERNFGRQLSNNSPMRIRVFLSENLGNYTSTQALLKGLEEKTEFSPRIEEYRGKDGQMRSKLVFIHKENPSDRLEAYNVNKLYTLNGLNAHYERRGANSFTQQVRDSFNELIPQCTSFPELQERMKQQGLILTIVKKNYGREKIYDRKNQLSVSKSDGSQSVEQRFLGKTYSYDSVKKQLARTDDQQLRERILTTIQQQAPLAQNTAQLWNRLATKGIRVEERNEVGPTGLVQKQLQFHLLDKTGQPRQINSPRNGLLTPLAIQRTLDEHNREKDKAQLREGIDQAIREGKQPDELALALKEQYGFDTKSSLRKIGEQTKTILTFSRMGQVKPISNNHLEDQYSTQRIIERCRSANPTGHVQYLNRIKANTTLYPIQINDQGYSLRTSMRDDLLAIRDQSNSFRGFLDRITQEGKYRWNYIEMNERGQPTTHQDHSGQKTIHGIGFGLAEQSQLLSGTAIDKELSFTALQRHFSQQQASRQSQSVGGGGGDPKAKNSAAPIEQAPRIQSTAGQVAASMEAQQNRIQADLDRQAAEISRQERDARAMDRRDHQPINSGTTLTNEQKPMYKKIRKRKLSL